MHPTKKEFPAARNREFVAPRYGKYQCTKDKIAQRKIDEDFRL
jgi:hypothetical protein